MQNKSTAASNLAQTGKGRPRFLHRIRVRLLLVVFVAVVPALALVIYGANKERLAAADDAHRQALRAAQLAAADYNYLIDESRRLLSLLAEVPAVRAADTQCAPFLASLLKHDARYANFGIIGTNGIIECSAVPPARGLDLSDRSYFQRALATRAFTVGELQIGRITGHTTVNLGYPVLDTVNRVRRVLFLALDIKEFNRIAAGAALPPHGALTVVDSAGVVLAHYPDPQRTVGEPLAETTLLKRLFKSAPATLEIEGAAGDSRFYAFVPLSPGHGGGMYVGVGVPKALALAATDRALRREIAAFAVVALLGFLAAWFGGDAFLLRNINTLIAATRRLATGDLAVRSGLAHTGGELGQLAQSFDAMAESLQTREEELAHAQADREHAQARFAGIVDIAAEAIVAVDDEQRIVLYNRGAEQVFGYTANEAVGQPLDLLLPERFAIRHGRHVRSFGKAPEPARRMGSRRAVYGRRKDGKEFPAEVSISKLERNGRLTYTAILRDITDQVQAEQEMRLLHTTALAVGAAPDQPAALGVALEKICQTAGWILGQAWVPRAGARLECCPAWYSAGAGFESFRAASLNMSFAPGEGLPGRVWLLKEPVWLRDITESRDFPRAVPPRTGSARDGGLKAALGVPVLAEGEVIAVLEFFQRERRAEDRRLTHIVATVAAQIGATMLRKQTEDRLAYLAHHDVLTGLPNRALFSDRLKQAMVSANRHERLVGVALLDLDRFKTINDSLGHETGDRLLKEVGTRLTGCVREGDTVARLGGDEFALVLAAMAHADDAGHVAQKILDAFAQPFEVDAHELFVTASLGMTLYPFDDNDADALLKNADVAMYRAKEAGRNNYQFYAEEMTAKTRARLKLENALRHAIAREEFMLHYQPVVDPRSSEITGVEALIRWRHPQLGLVPPAEFIPLAEETGLIVPIGEWVLRTACTQVLAWRREGHRQLKLAVNVSGRQFRQNDVVQRIAGVLAETGYPAKNLELELTESVLIENVDIIATLTAISGLGISLAIDDFGTGYSSLSYLKRFPIDRLKIDRSFINDVTTDTDAANLTVAIIAMAKSLNIDVVAEGVETEAQLDFLRGRGCHAVQGYYYSQPLPAADFVEWLNRWPKGWRKGENAAAPAT